MPLNGNDCGWLALGMNSVRADGLTLRPVPFVPEISIYQADDLVGLWSEMDVAGGDLPYWAFPWPGGQALSRHILDNPALVSGASMLDLGTGSGLCAIAAAKAGAVAVRAADIDPTARMVATRNGAENRVRFEVVVQDVLDDPPPKVDVLLAGDLFYERELAVRVDAWLRQAAGLGATVLVGDPGRHYFRPQELERLTVYDVPTSRLVEGSDRRQTGVYAYPISQRFR